jgi:hypothetical protein
LEQRAFPEILPLIREMLDWIITFEGPIPGIWIWKPKKAPIFLYFNGLRCPLKKDRGHGL